MTTIPHITWQISGGCGHECWYCLSKYRNNPNYKTLDEYLSVADKLLNYGSRRNIPQINWKFIGGEPLQFPNFNILLRQIKTRPGTVTLETSGGDSWFDILEIIDHLDKITMTHHYWQNETVLDYAVDLAKERKKDITIIIPLLPGQIKESKSKAQRLRDMNVDVIEQQLLTDQGSLISQYSLKDLNIIYGRPEDWEPPPPPPPPPPAPVDPNATKAVLPDPGWRDPSVSNGSPKYTGKSCWAGVDWLYIDSRGFSKASECGGRDLGNVFDHDWTPPDQAFACPMMFCHHQSDRQNIRIEI